MVISHETMVQYQTWLHGQPNETRNRAIRTNIMDGTGNLNTYRGWHEDGRWMYYNHFKREYEYTRDIMEYHGDNDANHIYERDSALAAYKFFESTLPNDRRGLYLLLLVVGGLIIYKMSR